MASSKSLPFVFIAALILITAVAWKFLASPENPTPVEQQPAVVTATETAPKTTEPAIKVVSYTDEEDTSNTELTEADYEELELKSKYFMKFNMRYSTPETALNGLKILRDEGDHERASALVNFIDESFPGTVIPLELLD